MSVINKNDFSRVIIIAHSNACFLIDKILSILGESFIDKNNLNKIEIYCFGNPVDKFKSIYTDIPYIEHIYNQYDTVSSFGLGSSNNNLDQLIDIDGKIISFKGRYGHFINEHYLLYINSLEGLQDLKDHNSKLYTYKNYGIK